MNQTNDGPTDWRELLASWDIQQTGYLPHREARFDAMFDVLAELLPEDFVAIDLASGPGSLSHRLLTRFPEARAVAVDFDPVLVALGRQASADMTDRLRFVEADIGTVDLASTLELEQVDAVLSSTALHWLPPDRLTRLYTQLGQLIRPDGVFLNGDNIPYTRGESVFQTMAEKRRARQATASFGEDTLSGWQQWWEMAVAQPALAAPAAEREKRMADLDRGHAEPVLEFHLAALRNAGFRAVDVVWQQLDDRIIAAVR